MPSPRPVRRRFAAVLAVAGAAVALALAVGCGGGAGDGTPDVVVTTPVLGAVVRDLVGDAADVSVVMPNGADPHEFQPSARDVAGMTDAALLVENGLDLEEGLQEAIGTARDEGVPVFTATDHVDLRTADGEGPAGEGGGGPQDPHVWMDPVAMADVAAALAPVLADRLGVDLGDRPAAVQRELRALDADIRAQLSDIPAARRRLVTGHDSMGYFADRYGFEVIGALIPSLSSQAQASASNLAGLRRQVEAAGVPAIFTEAGTPEGVADAIADETGARVIAIDTVALPDDGSYATLLRDVASAVDDGLGDGGG